LQTWWSGWFSKPSRLKEQVDILRLKFQDNACGPCGQPCSSVLLHCWRHRLCCWIDCKCPQPNPSPTLLGSEHITRLMS
jgi:hypothetical protein